MIKTIFTNAAAVFIPFIPVVIMESILLYKDPNQLALVLSASLFGYAYGRDSMKGEAWHELDWEKKQKIEKIGFEEIKPRVQMGYSHFNTVLNDECLPYEIRKDPENIIILNNDTLYPLYEKETNEPHFIEDPFSGKLRQVFVNFAANEVTILCDERGLRISCHPNERLAGITKGIALMNRRLRYIEGDQFDPVIGNVVKKAGLIHRA